MSADIKSILDDWPYDPAQNVRILRVGDRRNVLQIRVDQGGFQGILQMYLDGRPDGLRPYDREFCLDHFRGVLDAHRAREGSEKGFALSGAACQEIFDESFRIYERYTFLLQLHDYRRVVRDTYRNMTAFRFVNRYAESAEDRSNLERWWPYIIRINAEAKAMIAADDGALDLAIRILRKAITRIRGLPKVDAAEFHQERKRSLKALRELRDRMASDRPPTIRERLETELQTAIQQEEFETAAVLRDRLRNLVDR